MPRWVVFDAYLESENLEYEEDYPVRGGSTLIYDIDFGVKVRNTIKLVKLVSTTSPEGTRSTVDRISRLWLDIAQVTVDKGLRISLINDISLIWRPEEISVLSFISTVHTWSKKELFIEHLKVA